MDARLIFCESKENHKDVINWNLFQLEDRPEYFTNVNQFQSKD